jgi:hypothetical protein
MSADLKVSDLFAERRGPQESRPPIVHIVAREIADLRSRLTLRERAVLEPVVIITTTENLDVAIARALALSVEGDLVQVVMFEGKT